MCNGKSTYDATNIPPLQIAFTNGITQMEDGGGARTLAGLKRAAGDLQVLAEEGSDFGKKAKTAPAVDAAPAEPPMCPDKKDPKCARMKQWTSRSAWKSNFVTATARWRVTHNRTRAGHGRPRLHGGPVGPAGGGGDQAGLGGDRSRKSDQEEVESLTDRDNYHCDDHCHHHSKEDYQCATNL